MKKLNFDIKNDIVFTPENIASLMCKLAGVDENSVVIDNTAGGGNLLFAADKAGAKALIGIEQENDVYKMLEENVNECEHKDKFEIHAGDGMKYKELCEDADKINVVLSNPPYSFDYGGMGFAGEIMKGMKSGKAVILTKESVQCEEILQYATLEAVIKMPDIFKGYASVSTAIYVFQCGRPHSIDNDKVQFIDFSNDGYRRSGRKAQKGQLFPMSGEKPDDRYAELLSVIVGKNADALNYYKDCYVEDTLKEKPGWGYQNHAMIDTTVTIEDLKKVVSDYLLWKVESEMRKNKIK